MTKKQWLIAAILTFATICAWVVFDALHVRQQVEISPKVKGLIEPISPAFNVSNIEPRSTP